MCRTRIKVIDEYAKNAKNLKHFEELVNGFISNPENKVAKVNSVKTEIYRDNFKELSILAIINYELGD